MPPRSRATRLPPTEGPSGSSQCFLEKKRLLKLWTFYDSTQMVFGKGLMCVYGTDEAINTGPSQGAEACCVTFYYISQFFGSVLLCWHNDSQQQRKSTGINLFRKLCIDCLTPLFGMDLSAFSILKTTNTTGLICSSAHFNLIQFKHQMRRKPNGGNSF